MSRQPRAITPTAAPVPRDQQIAILHGLERICYDAGVAEADYDALYTLVRNFLSSRGTITLTEAVERYQVDYETLRWAVKHGALPATCILWPGVKKPRYDRVLTARSLIQERSRVVTWWHWQTPGKPSAAQTTTGSAPLEYLLGNNGQLSGVAALPPCRSIVANLGLDGQAIARPVG